MKRTKDWLKFFTGLLIMAFIFGFFASGYSLPGACGKVLRHNQKNSIDASPLFYTEVENMAELEDGVREMMEEAKIAVLRLGSCRRGQACPDLT